MQDKLSGNAVLWFTALVLMLQLSDWHSCILVGSKVLIPVQTLGILIDVNFSFCGSHYIQADAGV